MKKSIEAVAARHERLILAGILLATVLLQTTYINNGFTWLDHHDIEGRRAVVAVLQIPSAFLQRFGDTGFYRPVVVAVHSVDAVLYHQWAPGYHITNLLIHLAVTAVAGVFAGLFFG